MLQQIIALIIILFFIFRLFWQKQKNQISKNEFIFWQSFWFLSIIMVFSLKKIDQLVATLGFSSSGIDVLLYLSIIFLFYIIFRLRLRMEKLEKNITKIVREIAIKK